MAEKLLLAFMNRLVVDVQGRVPTKDLAADLAAVVFTTFVDGLNVALQGAAPSEGSLTDWTLKALLSLDLLTFMNGSDVRM